MESQSNYLLDNQQPQATVRFIAIAELFNPVTFRHVEALGISAGWRCWEVGAGGATVPAWLAERVGTTGSVLATDIDVSHLSSEGDYDVQVHDVGNDAVPTGDFDLVHARLVLVHVPARDQALQTLVDALAPGGWLLLEEADPALQPRACPDEQGDAERLANRLRDGFRTLMADRGVDLGFGRTLPRRLRDAGLVDVAADVYFPLSAPACRDLERATVRQIGDQLLARGLATTAEIDRHLRNLDDGLDVTTAPLVSAWGRKPGKRR